MVWPHPRDVILYARSSYFYDNMLIICLFSNILSDFKTCFGLKSRKIAGKFTLTLRFLTSCQHFFLSLVPCLQFTLRNVTAKAGTCNRRQPRFKG